MKNNDRLRLDEDKAYNDGNSHSICDNIFTANLGCVVLNLEYSFSETGCKPRFNGPVCIAV